jgi:hypothetical protein
MAVSPPVKSKARRFNHAEAPVRFGRDVLSPCPAADQLARDGVAMARLEG